MWRGLAGRLRALNLQAKLTLFAMLLVLIAVSATSLVAWRLIDQLAETVARERLDRAAGIVTDEYANLLENARITAEILAAWPLLEGPLTIEASEVLTTIQAALRNRYGDLIAVVGPDGITQVEIQRGRSPSRGASLRADDAVARALAGEPAEGLEIVDDGVRAVVALPVRSGQEILGAVMVASFLDDALVDRLKSATNFDITLYAGDHAAATTLRLPSGARQTGVLAPLEVLTEVLTEGQPMEQLGRGAQGRVIVRYYPLHGITGQSVGMFSISAPVAVLLEPRTQILAVFAPVVAAVLLLALAAAAYTARALSRPIWGLARAVQRIGEGDLSSPVPTAGHDEVGVLARATEDMRLRLSRHAEEQEQLNRLKDQYLFSMAHELKTPLTALVATVELLAQDDALPAAERAHLITMVERSTRRLRALVDNLLDLANLRTGRFNVSPRPACLDDILAEAVASAQPLLDARHQRVESALADPPPVVLADARRIQQVLVNLLSNAIKYGPEGDVIRVRAEQLDDQVRVDVTDHGPGIPPEEQPYLFEAYFRSALAQQLTPGVGLGLAIVKAIVEAHGGQVGVESAPQQGTTVWFTLPRADIPEGSVRAPAAAAPALSAAGQQGASA